MSRALVAALVACMALAACGTRTPVPPTPAGPALIHITLVEVLTRETFPVQLTAHLRGEPPGAGCWSKPEHSEPQRAGTTIAITVTSVLTPGCTAEPWIYDETIALGSDFGTDDYVLTVNGVEQDFHFDSGFGP